MKWRPKFSGLNFAGKKFRAVGMKCNYVLLLTEDSTLKFIIKSMRSEVLGLIDIYIYFFLIFRLLFSYRWLPTFQITLKLFWIRRTTLQLSNINLCDSRAITVPAHIRNLIQYRMNSTTSQYGLKYAEQSKRLKYTEEFHLSLKDCNLSVF
jgi:hypothetical protein